MTSERLSRELNRAGYSVTKPRLAVFEYLATHGPVAMANLCESFKTFDRSSVYRTVALFEDLGFIRRVNLGWKYKLELSELFTAHHHHLHCRNCDRIIDIKDSHAFDKVVHELSKKYKFYPSSHELEISGWCQSCSATAEIARQ